MKTRHHTCQLESRSTMTCRISFNERFASASRSFTAINSSCRHWTSLLGACCNLVLNWNERHFIQNLPFDRQRTDNSTLCVLMSAFVVYSNLFCHLETLAKNKKQKIKNNKKLASLLMNKIQLNFCHVQFYLQFLNNWVKISSFNKQKF